MNSNDQIDAFNGIVSDYNGRCGSYRYRQGAVKRAKREIEPYRAAIVANAWDGLSLTTKSAPQQRPAVQRSQLTMDIQEALSELGYQPGVADGIYGQKTRAAIEAFQRDNNIRIDGLASQKLLVDLERARSLRRTSTPLGRGNTAVGASLATGSKPDAQVPPRKSEPKLVLAKAENESLEAACSTDKYSNGPVAYRSCVDRHLAALRRGPRRPNLSTLSDPERQSIEAACSTDKYLNRPATYNRCLSRQLASLR